MSYCSDCKQDIRIGGPAHTCLEIRQRKALREKAEAMRKRMEEKGIPRLTDEIINQTIRYLTRS